MFPKNNQNKLRQKKKYGIKEESYLNCTTILDLRRDNNKQNYAYFKLK